VRRQGNTGKAMVGSGAWVRVAKKHYRHVSGVEIVYRCNHWVWAVVEDGKPETRWSMLWVARYEAERTATATGFRWDAPMVQA